MWMLLLFDWYYIIFCFFFFQAEDGIRDLVRSRGLGDVYKRQLQAFEEAGQADNTLVFYIAGDNGTSGEGGENGMYSEMTYFNGVQEKVEDMLKLIDKWGGPETYPHMAAGWAVALDAPFGWMKQVGADFGGTRNGMVVSWPKGIKAKNEIRTQFSHVIDVAPTVLQAARCLLYTSPSPRDRTRYRMPSSA